MLTERRRSFGQAFTEVGGVSPTLSEITAFGCNPGQLRMLIHVPDKLPAKPALLVCLHGCTQSAASYDTGSGWSKLAGRAGFIALFPEQQQSNNPNRCFNWFDADDTRRSSGEVLSIREMIDHAVRTNNIDCSRIFVIGLSAGGAMASSLLAAYPELFAAGAIIAGLPHGSAGSLAEALVAMSKSQERTSLQWGDIVRSASSHRGPWPRISLWHGSSDILVRPMNAEASVLQWTNLHGVSIIPNSDMTIGNHRVRTWQNQSGKCVVEAHTIVGMGHGVPLALDSDNCSGQAGPFHLDVGVASSWETLRFFGMLDADFAPALDDSLRTLNGNIERGAPLPSAAFASADKYDSVLAILRRAGVINQDPGGSHDSPLSQKVQGVINRSLRAAGLLK